jgi:hypothetical protein
MSTFEGNPRYTRLLSLLHEASRSESAPLLPFGEPPKEQLSPDALPFKFIDLFAGIGGFRAALGKLGGECVFSSEWDRYSQKTYKAWYWDTPEGDIRKIRPADIPDHDVLAAGFPCQPFSIAGVSKKKSLGQAHGFKCVTQGTLFINSCCVIWLLCLCRSIHCRTWCGTFRTSNWSLMILPTSGKF